MKKLLLLAALLCTAAFTRAEDVALMQVRLPDGQIVSVGIALHEGDAPATVANFKRLANDGFYRGCSLHRVIEDRLVQTGDPLSKRSDRSKVGTSGPGYTLPAEIRGRHTAGAVAMARLPDRVNPQRRSNGSQFYITLMPQPALDGQYTVFGHVILGLDQLNAISHRPTDANDNPTDRIDVRSLRIIPREQLPAASLSAAPAKRSFWSRLFRH
jgi:cyclophilin family peptidyl-prolyl cis-trans isomerase